MPGSRVLEVLPGCGPYFFRQFRGRFHAARRGYGGAGKRPSIPQLSHYLKGFNPIWGLTYPARALRREDDLAQPAAVEPIARSRGHLAWFAVAIALTALKLWLVSAQTVSALSPTPHDDELFLRGADAILAGRWLGAFDENTLVKGPVYALWLALVHASGVRLLVAQALLYAAASAVLAIALRPALPRCSRRTLLYLAILFNPVTWADGPATRVLREGIYSSLTLLLLGLAIGAALRLDTFPRRSALWATGAGLAGAALSMTREEGVWLEPSLGIVLLAGALAARHRRRRTIAAVLAAAVAYAVPTAVVASLNWAHYGLFETCETRSGYFNAAYGALTRVKTDRWNRYVPVSREVREKAYAVSPALREIAPHLEGAARGWTGFGCKAVGVCDDIAGGWFMWALRQAATRANVYRDGATARGWYERAAREIDGACRDGRLECLAPRSTMMPPWHREYARPLLSALGRAAAYLVTLEGMSPYPSAPRANPPALTTFERLTNERLPRPLLIVEGVVTGAGGALGATVLDPRGAPASASIRQVPVSAVAGEPSASQVRVAALTECAADCMLALSSADGRTMVVPLAEDSRPFGGAALTWKTESLHRASIPPMRDHDRRLRALEAVTRILSVALPVLVALAGAVLLRRLVRAARSGAPPVLSLVALALLAGVAVRLLLLALIDVTSFPAINVVYLSPAYGLLIAFAALVLVGGTERPSGTSGAEAPGQARG